LSTADRGPGDAGRCARRRCPAYERLGQLHLLGTFGSVRWTPGERRGWRLLDKVRTVPEGSFFENVVGQAGVRKSRSLRLRELGQARSHGHSTSQYAASGIPRSFSPWYPIVVYSRPQVQDRLSPYLLYGFVCHPRCKTVEIMPKKKKKKERRFDWEATTQP